MECRPFKDPTYDLRRMEQDMAVQAVPLTQDLAVQATPARVGPTAYHTPFVLFPPALACSQLRAMHHPYLICGTNQLLEGANEVQTRQLAKLPL